MRNYTRTLAFEVKRAPTDGSGRGTALAYAYDAKDTDPLIDRDGLYVSRMPLPLLWGHDGQARGMESNPSNIIGKIVDARNTADGFEIDFLLDLKNERAMTLYEQLLRGFGGELSIGFAGAENDAYKDDEGRWHLRRAEVYEVSFVTSGANRGTRVIDIKAAGARRASSIRAEASADDFRREMLDRADAVLWLSKSRGCTTAEAERLLDQEDGASFKTRVAAMYPEGAKELELAKRREAEAAAVLERRRAATQALDDYNLTHMGTRPAGVRVGLDMRPLSIEGEDEREADRQARDAEKLEERARARAREAREREAAAVQPAPPGVSRGEGVTTYAP